MKALVDCGSQEGVAALEKAELGKKKTGVEPIMISAYHYFYNQIRGFVAEPFGETMQDERNQSEPGTFDSQPVVIHAHPLAPKRTRAICASIPPWSAANRYHFAAFSLS